MSSMTPQHRFRVTVSGLPGSWETRGGGNKSGDVNKRYDGDGVQHQIPGRPDREDVTVARAFQPNRDWELAKELDGKVLRWRTTITEIAQDLDGIPVGKPATYPDALLTGVTHPEYDANGDDPGEIELTFSVVTRV